MGNFKNWPRVSITECRHQVDSVEDACEVVTVQAPPGHVLDPPAPEKVSAAPGLLPWVLMAVLWLELALLAVRMCMA